MKHVELYTDGACSGNPGPGGYGLILLYEHFRKEGSGGFSETTNNRMEILAAVSGLELLLEPCEVVIYSDSSYLVDAIEKKWIDQWIKRGWRKSDKTPVVNVDLWERLLAAMKSHQVKFVWVKGHSSNVNNNRCDELARQECFRKDLPLDPGFERH